VGEKSSPNPNPQDPKPADIRPETAPLPSLFITTSPVSALAKWREHQIEEVKASSWIQTIELIQTLPQFHWHGGAPGRRREKTEIGRQ